jgi:hypothetical protein
MSLRTTIRAAVILVMMAAFCFAQSPAPTPVPTLPDYPQYFFTGGLRYTPDTPHLSAWVAAAVLMDKTKGSYSFTGSYLTLDSSHHIVNNYTTGMAQHTKDIGGVSIYTIMAAGASVTTVPYISTSIVGSSIINNALNRTTVGLALNGGFMAIKPVKNGFGINFMGQAISSAGKAGYIGGVGGSWGH